MDRKKVISLSNADIYQRENKILSEVNMDVHAGELLYIIGKVGTGKTSLIKTFNAELPLVKGKGEILGADLGNIKQKEIAALRRRMGVVFQDFRLLTDRSVADNLIFVLKATGWKNKTTINERVDEVLKTVGEGDKKNKMPHELSGGEQQRIVIARALLNNPDLILADEPTGNLDPETSDEILGIFLQLNKQGKTIVVATHDYAVIARKPSRTIVCRDGKVSDSENNTEKSTFDDLLEENQ